MKRDGATVNICDKKGSYILNKSNMVQRGLYSYRQRVRVIKVRPQHVFTTVMTYIVYTPR